MGVDTRLPGGARAVDGPQLSAVHYMTLYLMAEPLDVTLREFRALGAHLRTVGRFHAHRRARLSGPFDVTGMAAAPRVLVSGEAVAFRPNRGVYVVVRDGEEPGDRRQAATAQLLAADGVAGVWNFNAADRFTDLGWKAGRRAITVCYLDLAPLDVAPALGTLVRGTDSADAPVAFAGPLETITPWEWGWFDQEADAPH